MNIVCFLNIPGKQQHFNLANGKLVYVFIGNQYFRTKLTLSTVSEPFIFPRHTRNFGAKRNFIHKHSLHIAYL